MNNMNINITLDDIQMGQSDSLNKFIEAGIPENIGLKDVKFDISKANNKFICFYFEDENKAITSDTEYEPRPFESSDKIPQFIKEKIKEKNPNANDNDFIREHYKSGVVDFISKVCQILVSAGVTREQIQIPSVFDFEMFSKHAIALLNGVGYTNKKFRVKFVYNKNGFTSLPPKHKSHLQFIEPMDVTKADSKIQQYPSDKFERPVADKEKQGAENPFGGSAKTEDNPF